MKWYQMDSDAQDNLDMKKLIDEWGWDWYGRYWAILGRVAKTVSKDNLTFALQTNDGRPFPVRLLSDDCSTTVERMTNFLKFLADNRLIDRDSWYSKKLIYCPKLKERADEYTHKLLTVSRQTPDSVGTKNRIDKNRIDKNTKSFYSKDEKQSLPYHKNLPQ